MIFCSRLRLERKIKNRKALNNLFKCKQFPHSCVAFGCVHFNRIVHPTIQPNEKFVRYIYFCGHVPWLNWSGFRSLYFSYRLYHKRTNGWMGKIHVSWNVIIFWRVTKPLWKSKIKIMRPKENIPNQFAIDPLYIESISFKELLAIDRYFIGFSISIWTKIS